MPMDGFHYDNAVLEPRGLLPRKGAPQTFDVDGFIAALARIRAGSTRCRRAGVRPQRRPVARRRGDHFKPPAASCWSRATTLLLDAEPWQQTARLFDMTVFLSVPREILEQRLVRRWLDHGLAPDAARTRALSNDIPNALLVMERSRPADVVLDNY